MLAPFFNYATCSRQARKGNASYTKWLNIFTNERRGRSLKHVLPRAEEARSFVLFWFFGCTVRLAGS